MFSTRTTTYVYREISSNVICIQKKYCAFAEVNFLSTIGVCSPFRYIYTLAIPIEIEIEIQCGFVTAKIEEKYRGGLGNDSKVDVKECVGRRDCVCIYNTLLAANGVRMLVSRIVILFNEICSRFMLHIAHVFH